MPPALLAIPAGIAAIGAEVAAAGSLLGATGLGTLTIGGFGGNALFTLGALGLSFGASALQSRQAAASARRQRLSGLGGAQKQTVRTAIAARRMVYGRAMVGGVVGFIEALPLGSGPFPGSLLRMDVLCDGPVNAIETIFVGDVQPLIDSSGGAFEPESITWYSPSVLARVPAFSFETRIGSIGQPVSALLNAAFPAAFDSAAQANGVAYLAVRMASVPPVDQGRIYPQGANTQIRAVVRGSSVWDPRLGSNPATARGWSRSPALAALHILTATDPAGRPIWFGIPASLIDTAGFIAAANSDDAQISLPNGRTRPRFACDGVLPYDTEPRRLIEQVLDCGDYNLFLNSEGKVTIRGGALWQVPALHLTPDAILEVIDSERGPSLWERANLMRPVYICPELRHEPQDAAPVSDPSAPAITGAVIEETLDLPFVHSHDQARHLARIALTHRNAGWKLKLRCAVSALAAWDEEGVRITLPELQLADASFRILRRELAEDMASVTLELVQWSGAPAWGSGDWVAPAALPPDTSNVPLIPRPRNMALTSTGTGGGVATLTATWEPPTSGEFISLFWRQVGAGALNEVRLPPGTSSHAIAGLPATLPGGVTYEAFAVCVTTTNHHYGGADSIPQRLALADDTPPGPVTGAVVADFGPGQARLTATAPASPQLVDITVTATGQTTGPIWTQTITPAPSGAIALVASGQAGEMITFVLTPRNARGESAPGSVVSVQGNAGSGGS